MLESAILPALHVTLDYFIVINVGGMVILLILAIIILVRQTKLNKKYKKFRVLFKKLIEMIIFNRFKNDIFQISLFINSSFLLSIFVFISNSKYFF